MFAIKFSLLITLLASLALPASVLAESSISIGKPYYKNYNHQPRHYNSRANDYSKRHNFRSNRSTNNPYLNRDFANQKRHNIQSDILVRPSYGNRVNIRQRGFDRFQPHNGFRQGYKRGYQRGFNDGISRKRGYQRGFNDGRSRKNKSYRLGQ